MDSPLSKLSANYFTTWESTPFCFASISSSVHTNPPFSGNSKPDSMSALVVGSDPNPLLSCYSFIYFGGGANCKYSYLLSANDFGPTPKLLLKR